MQEFTVIVRIDPPHEMRYYRHGGILPCVVRQRLAHQMEPRARAVAT